MADNLTPRQQEILQLIRDTVELEGRPPTRAEICTAFGFRSPNAAETHLRALAAKGAITLEEGRARGIRLMEALGLPLIGRVAAGSPILAAEHVQGRYQVDPGLFSPRADYLLKVRGMSMRDAGILDGSVVLVDRAITPADGQIVLAVIDGDFTCKTLRLQGEGIRLQAAHPDYPDIVPKDGQSVEIWGVVVATIHQHQT